MSAEAGHQGFFPQLKYVSYSEPLKACNLPTLCYRRIRGDMIDVYKIITGKYDPSTAPQIIRPHSTFTRVINLD